MTTTPMTDDDRYFRPRIPRAGVEACALGAGISTDLNGSNYDGAFTEGVEAFGGGVLTYAVFQALLTFFTLEPSVKAGVITRGEQMRQVRSTAWEATKGGAVAVVAVSILLAVFPFLAPVAGIVAIGGGLVVGTRLASVVMDAYTPAQKAVLKEKAEEAGITIDRWLGDDEAPDTASSPA